MCVEVVVGRLEAAPKGKALIYNRTAGIVCIVHMRQIDWTVIGSVRNENGTLSVCLFRFNRPPILCRTQNAWVPFQQLRPFLKAKFAVTFRVVKLKGGTPRPFQMEPGLWYLRRNESEGGFYY